MCIRLAAPFLLAGSIFAAHALAQDSNLTVQAIDRVSAVLPGATVTLTPVSGCADSRTPTGAMTIARTNGQGVAAFPAVERQAYRVEATLTGFTTATICIRFEPAEPRVQIALTAGVLAESVTTPGSTPVLDLRQAGNQLTPCAAPLVNQFKAEPVFWRQQIIAVSLIACRDRGVLPELTDWLTHEDRHTRGNVALVFGGLGDDRGLETILAILDDRSSRPEGQGIAVVPGDGRYHFEAQVATDRYYAAHLLGDLKDPRAIPTLTALMNDPQVNMIVPWSLGQIDGARAIESLIKDLGNPDPSVRVLAIQALQTRGAREALPRLRSLLADYEKSRFGTLQSVAEAARVAIATIEAAP
jgi:hypothetical protein